MENEVKKSDLKDTEFIAFDENGDERKFSKLFEFDSKETGKHYLAYTDNKIDSEGNYEAYGAIVEVSENKEYVKLLPIETEREWKVLEMVLNEQNEQNEQKN